MEQSLPMEIMEWWVVLEAVALVDRYGSKRRHF
jgi:hypothetical protein